jgi:CRP-like cAMP-binding protein
MRRLAELPLFAGLDSHALEAIGSAVTEESVEAGRIIVREGDFAQDLTIIDEGTARVERDGAEVATLGPGDTFGEQGLLAKTQRNATVVAVDDMRLIHLTKFDLNRIKGSHPEVVARFDEIASARD